MKKMCPIFSVINKAPTQCHGSSCAWFHEENEDLGTPDECIIISVDRHLLDIRMTIEKFLKPMIVPHKG